MQNHIKIRFAEDRSLVRTVVNRPRVGCYSQVLAVAYSCLLIPTDALVSTHVLASSMLSAFAAWTDIVYLGRSLPLDLTEAIQLLPPSLCIHICCAHHAHA